MGVTKEAILDFPEMQMSLFQVIITRFASETVCDLNLNRHAVDDGTINSLVVYHKIKIDVWLLFAITSRDIHGHGLYGTAGSNR